jgi:electron transfer flavoprotein alpha subunit
MKFNQHIFRQFASKIAVLLEGGGSGGIAPCNKHVISAALKLSTQVCGVALDGDVARGAQSLQLSQIYHLKADADLRLAENACAVLARFDKEHGPDRWLCAHTAFGKNIMPRLSAMLSIPCISDVIGIEDATGVYKRPIYAGNAIATIECKTPRQAITVRSTAFEPCQLADGQTVAVSEKKVDIAGSGDGNVQYIRLDAGNQQMRPELAAARVVISGGRALKTKEDFERLLGALADAIPGAAVGASRAAVDSGLAPNDLQVGQTGKVVAPSLYMAVGISGAIQHVAGMKDSKVIVAINKDGDCPIFQLADYGLVGDLFKLLPELTEKIKQL